MFVTFLLFDAWTHYPPSRRRSQLPIGFGGSYEEYWRGEYDYGFEIPSSFYPFYRHPYAPRFPQIRRVVPPQRQSTLGQKVERIRHELSISHDVSFADTISQANSMMGLESVGTLAHQLDRLLDQLA